MDAEAQRKVLKLLDHEIQFSKNEEVVSVLQIIRDNLPKPQSPQKIVNKIGF